MKTAFIVILILSTCCAEEWGWAWKCHDNKFCKKVQTTENLYSSIESCRLVCGEYGALWPLPTRSTRLGTILTPISHSYMDYTIESNNEDTKIYLDEVLKIFKENLNKECGPKCCPYVPEVARKITVSLSPKDDTTTLLPNTDESYVLRSYVADNDVLVSITAPTVFGVRHGIETLSQLVARSYNYDSNCYSLVMNNEAYISDKPVFGHRGILLDTGRNFLPKETITRQMDAMAASKMNVLHWHATDSQSFPLNLPNVRILSEYGAYVRNRSYSEYDIQYLTNYAKHRGIRIITEIDAPAHAGNGWQWGETIGLGKLAVCVNQQPWRDYCIQPPCGQLNPVNKYVFSVLRDLYTEIDNLMTRGEYFHMGGDEVYFPCWNTTEEIVYYMESKGWGRNLTGFLSLWNEYQENALAVYDNITKNSNISVILWSSDLTEPDTIEKYLPKNRYIIQTWVPASSDLNNQLLMKGYRLIISTKDAWYLDHGFWGTTIYHTWREVYSNILNANKLVLGGEVCMWGELVEDGSIDSKIWPRAAAAAERLWSNPTTSTEEAETRMYRHRERLVSRNIRADSLAPRWCIQTEGECF